MSEELRRAAEAYRAERSRYWVHHVKFGETKTPGGSTSIMGVQVKLSDDTLMFSGMEEPAKAWLDQRCLAKALTKLLCEPSDALCGLAGREMLQSIASHVIPAE